MSGGGGALPMLHLYRHILKAAKHFPSRKKDGIIRSIKQEFRDNKDLKDEAKLSKARAVAERGLADLQAYLPRGGGDDGRDISVSLRGATTEL